MTDPDPAPASEADRASAAADAPSWGRSDWTGAYSVWAPSAGAIRLRWPGGTEMRLTETEGWHRAENADLRPGERYSLLIGGRTVPDPASRSQPEGPDAASEVVDPDGFAWTDAAWQGRPWSETVLYELHIGTFTPEGTFSAAIERLDHLARLGVTTIELMPVGEFAGSRGWGYDGVLPFAPFHHYGRPDELKRLIDRAHALGLAVVLDVVFNHFGPKHNFIADYAPEFFTDAHHTPWGGAIDFARPAVRRFFVENALYWIKEFHLDGLRLDAVQAIFDDGARHILDEIAERGRQAAAGRHLHLMLENDNNDARWLRRTAEGEAAHYDAQWNDDFHHVMRVLLAGRTDGYYRDYAADPVASLGRALAEGFSYQGETESIHRPGLFRGTRSGHLPPTAFVNFLQNHDQVGNTPFGKRLAALASPAALRLGAAALLLGPAIPMLFMGEEWAAAEPFDYFCDYDPALADAVRKGRRDEFKHLPEFSDPAQLAQLADPNARATRDRCVLDWTAPGRAPHAATLAFTRELILLRHREVVPLLEQIGGGAGSWAAIGERALSVRWRLDDGRTLALAANFSDAPAAWERRPGRVLHSLEGGAAAPWGFDLVLED